jgi:hypothetical protein
MNQIRKKNEKYEVLITPTKYQSYDYEYLLGDWNSFESSLFDGYKIVEVDTLEKAKHIANKFPELKFEKLFIDLNNSHVDLKETIKNNLNSHDIHAQVFSSIMTPIGMKNTFFDRVAFYKKNFNLSLHMNDTIKFIIVLNNDNCIKNIVELLSNDCNLSIKNVNKNNNEYHLTGVTYLGTTFLIIVR